MPAADVKHRIGNRRGPPIRSRFDPTCPAHGYASAALLGGSQFMEALSNVLTLPLTNGLINSRLSAGGLIWSSYAIGWENEV